MGHKYKDKYISIKDIYKNIKINIYKHIDYSLYYNIIKRFFEILIRDVVERDRRLYDRITNSFVFTDDIVTDVVVLLDFDGLPEVARRYITLRASRKFQENLLGSQTLSQLQADEEQSAFIALLQSEGEIGDYNIFDHYDTYRHVDRSISTSTSTLV